MVFAPRLNNSPESAVMEAIDKLFLYFLGFL
jgi:hypothetical protein